MIVLPEKLTTKYNRLMAHENIPVNVRPYFLKWLRYYVDFCHKYQKKYSDHSSLVAFLEKLTSKQQSDEYINQAREAVQLYYAMLQPSKPQGLMNLSPVSPDFTAGKETTSVSWRWVYEKLESEIKMRHYSTRTLRSYSSWVRRLQNFVHSKDAATLDVNDVKDFLSYLAVEKEVSASSQNQAFNGLLFLFRRVLGKDFGKMDGVVRAKQRKNIPVVLSRDEVDRVISCCTPPCDLVVSLLYGCGLRLFECMKLRVQDFNFSTGILIVHNGKGKKDRSVPLPKTLEVKIQKQLDHVAQIHRDDCAVDYAGVFLEGRLDKKYKNAARELPWQWFFPARMLTFVPEEGEHRRYHLHESHIQKAIRKAAKKAAIPKRVTAHTFRHSYASHLLAANYDIRTIQKLLGHSNLQTTMIYTHTVPDITEKVAKSPLDLAT